MQVKVSGAGSEGEAAKVARSVASSSLTKAWYNIYTYICVRVCVCFYSNIYMCVCVFDEIIRYSFPFQSSLALNSHYLCSRLQYMGEIQIGGA